MRRLRAQPEGRAFTNHIQTEWMCYNCFVLWYVSGSKAPLACVSHEEQFYTVGPMPQNCAGFLADGKPWVSMLLSRNGFTMPTHVTNLAFRISTNVATFGATNQLAIRITLHMHEAHSASWLIERVWLCNDCLLSQVGAYFNSSEACLVEISVNAKET